MNLVFVLITVSGLGALQFSSDSLVSLQTSPKQSMNNLPSPSDLVTVAKSDEAVEALTHRLKNLLEVSQSNMGLFSEVFASSDFKGVIESFPSLDIHCVLTNLSTLCDIIVQILQCYGKRQWDDLPSLLHQFVDTFNQLRHC